MISVESWAPLVYDPCSPHNILVVLSKLLGYHLNAALLANTMFSSTDIQHCWAASSRFYPVVLTSYLTGFNPPPPRLKLSTVHKNKVQLFGIAILILMDFINSC